MKIYRSMAMCAALCVVLVGLSAEAKGPNKDTALLDQVITQEIDSRQSSIKQWQGFLMKADMTIDGQIRVETFIQLLKQEIVYLGELKAHGTIRMKKAYCIMLLQQRISVMSFEVKFKRHFGNKSEASPKTQAVGLSDKQVEAIQKKLKETTVLKKKIESITTN